MASSSQVAAPPRRPVVRRVNRIASRPQAWRRAPPSVTAGLAATRRPRSARPASSPCCWLASRGLAVEVRPGLQPPGASRTEADRRGSWPSWLAPPTRHTMPSGRKACRAYGESRASPTADQPSEATSARRRVAIERIGAEESPAEGRDTRQRSCSAVALAPSDRVARACASDFEVSVGSAAVDRLADRRGRRHRHDVGGPPARYPLDRSWPRARLTPARTRRSWTGPGPAARCDQRDPRRRAARAGERSLARSTIGVDHRIVP